MRTILEELWYGNVCPNADCMKANKQEKELMGYISDHRHKLKGELTPEQNDIFEKLDDCYSELTDMYEREIFVYAFRLGARIAIDVMNFDVE